MLTVNIDDTGVQQHCKKLIKFLLFNISIHFFLLYPEIKDKPTKKGVNNVACSVTDTFAVSRDRKCNFCL